MRSILLSLFHILAYALAAKAQFAVIRDADGFTNVRAGMSVTAKIVGKFHDGDVFGYYDSAQNGWIKVYHFPADSPENRYLEGYIHKDHLLPIDKLRQLPNKGKTLTSHHLTLHNDSVTVEITTVPFRPKQHVLRKDDYGQVIRIDHKRPLGTDGEMPLEKLAGLHMTIRGRAVDIPAAAWDNLYDPTLDKCNILFDTRTGFMYIYLPNWRSAAGGYELFWVFKNGRYIKRYVDQSEN